MFLKKVTIHEKYFFLLILSRFFFVENYNVNLFFVNFDKKP